MAPRKKKTNPDPATTLPGSSVNSSPESDKRNGQSVNPAVGVWPADRVRRLPVDKLVPYALNARLHTDSQVDQLVIAIKRFGFTSPVVVDSSGSIIAGHGRIMAAKKIGLTQVPGVVIAEGEWSEDDVRAYRIWDNQSALLSTWDDELLRVDIQALNVQGYDLQLLGFPAATLGVILDGWSSDVNVRDRFGSNLDGIKAKIIITVEPGQAERAGNVVKKALSDAGIAHEIT